MMRFSYHVEMTKRFPNRSTLTVNPSLRVHHRKISFYLLIRNEYQSTIVETYKVFCIERFNFTVTVEVHVTVVF